MDIDCYNLFLNAVFLNHVDEEEGIDSEGGPLGLLLLL